MRHVLVAFVLLLAWTYAASPEQAASTLILNATLVDGTGIPARQAAVRLAGERIEAVGALAPARGERVIDAKGLTLAPGFIDTHSHHDRGILDAREVIAATSQGITTIVVGQDGGSSYPLADFFARLQSQPVAVNVASYVGHGTLRRRVMGDDFRRHAKPEEITAMADLARSEMHAGALGLSSGLEYDPGIYSDTSEVVALGRAVAALGGRYITHIRSEDREFWKAVEEAIRIGRETRMPVQISHLKLAMRSLWGETDRLVKMLDAARASGVQVTADVYPYTYWQSGMTVLFPDRDFTDRKAAEFALREVTTAEGMLITRYEKDPSYEGKTLAEVAHMRGADAPQAMMDLIRDSGGDVGIVATSMKEEDVLALTKWPFANICSDGASSGGHPRGRGAFTRALGRYVREQRAFTVEEAVRKMTSLSADNLGLKERGTIAAGHYADLVLFDPATVIDRATTADPYALSDGIHTVWVNGEIVFAEGRPTAARPGRIVRRQ